MKTKIITNRVALVLLVVVLTVLWIQPTQPAQAEDPLVKGARGLAPRAEFSVLASGAAEDTLKACMARIPVVASAGQRMLAEQSCASEEKTRKTIQSAPKF